MFLRDDHPDGTRMGTGMVFQDDRLVSLATGRDKNDEDLKGLVYSLTPHVAKDESLSWYERPWILAAFVLAVSIVLNYIFW